MNSNVQHSIDLDLTSHKDVVSTSDTIESVQDETASFPGRVGMRLKMAVSLDPVPTLFTRHSHTCQRNALRQTHADPVSNARHLYRELLGTRLRCNEGAAWHQTQVQRGSCSAPDSGATRELLGTRLRCNEGAARHQTQVQRGSCSAPDSGATREP